VRIIFFVLALMVIMTIYGCEGERGINGESGPVIVEANMLFRTSPVYHDFSYTFLSMSVEHFREWPFITINSDTIQYRFGGYQTFDYPIMAGETFDVDIRYININGDSAYTYANFAMPGQFAILSHDTSLTSFIERDDTLSIFWSRSPGANNYSVRLRLEHYYQTPDYISSATTLIDTFMVDTSLIINASLLFPDTTEHDFIWTARGDFEIWAYRAPDRPGYPSDFLGDGYGFVRAETFGGRFYIEEDTLTRY